MDLAKTRHKPSITSVIKVMSDFYERSLDGMTGADLWEEFLTADDAREMFARSRLELSHIPESPGIYAIVNKVTNERYVGQATNMRRRIQSHIRELEAGHHFANIKRRWLQDAWTKYGSENFEFIVLEVVHNNKGHQPYHERADNLSLAEQYYINQKSEYNPDKGICHARHKGLVDSLAWRCGSDD